MDKYSVLMSIYKKEHPEYLEEALESMINQTVKPDEIVLVEDGPLTDDLYTVIDQYCKNYPGLFNIVINETNLGLGLALNNGLKVCKNNLVARMDTDDISKPDRCEKQLNLFNEKPELVIVGSHIDEFEGTPTNVISQRKVPLLSNDIYDYAKKRAAFNHPSVMFKRSVILSEGGYSDLKRNQDVELFGRMMYKGYKAENIDESLLYFRTSTELAERRKTWDNCWSYITTIFKFWKMGYSSLWDVLLVSFAQLIMFLLPWRTQLWIYKNLLR